MSKSTTLPKTLGNIPVFTPMPETVYIKALIYGDPGVGKTTLAASAQAVPEMQDCLFLDIEGGTMALTHPSVYGAETAPTVWRFPETKGFDALQEVFTELYKGGHGFKTLVVDSLSELARYNLDHVINSKPDKKNRDEDEVFLEDYGANTKQMRRLLRLMRNLPMHTIFLTHADEPKELAEAKTGLKVVPSLTPKLRKSVEGFMDVIGYLYVSTSKDEETKVETTTRKLLTKPGTRWMAKDRSPGGTLPRIMDDPTMQQIYNFINRVNDSK